MPKRSAVSQTVGKEVYEHYSTTKAKDWHLEYLEMEAARQGFPTIKGFIDFVAKKIARPNQTKKL